MEKDRIDLNGKAIVITGAGSGIGLSAVKILAAEGFTVFAGVRKTEDRKMLSEISNVRPVALDVTSQEDVDKAFQTIKESGLDCAGLVHSAGLTRIGALVEVSDKDLQTQFDVNVFGVHRVTRKFFPLLLPNKGRIVIIGSLSGRIAFPFMGPYAMSKHANEAYADSLRRELSPLGMKVVLIEPGKISTPFLDKAIDLIELVMESTSELFKERGLKMAAYDKARVVNALPAEVVGTKIKEALLTRNPKTRYLIVKNTFKTRLLLSFSDRKKDSLFDKL